VQRVQPQQRSTGRVTNKQFQQRSISALINTSK